MKSKLTGPKTSLILDGLKQGKTETQIARECSVHQSSISRFISKIRPLVQEKEDLVKERGNLMSYLHGKNLALQEMALEELERMMIENGKKAPKERMRFGQLLYLLRGVNVNAAVLFDKLRLEGGQSTSNVGLVGKIEHAHKMVGVFESDTGEFKASVTGPIEKIASKQVDALKPVVENESNQ